MLNHKRLEDLIQYPRENLNTEIKGWLDLSNIEDKTNIAKAAIAHANSGGGYIIIGFKEVDGTYLVDEPIPETLIQYNQDDINAIINKYAEPPFHCDVCFVVNPDNQKSFPVITIPGNLHVPIKSKRHGPNGKHLKENAYYIRRPGPKSEPPQSGKEWDDLIGRCVRAAKDDLLDDFRSILFGVGQISNQQDETDELNIWIDDCSKRWFDCMQKQTSIPFLDPALVWPGSFSVGYRLIDQVDKVGLSEFLETLRKVSGHETGWPPWWVPTRKEISPYIKDETIECFLGNEDRDPSHSDFWRASPNGLMFLRRGLQEDGSPEKGKSGTAFDLTLPIWRTSECLLHAYRLGGVLVDKESTIEFQVSWEGLENRKLVVWGGSQRMIFDDYIARQNYYTNRITVKVSDIKNGLPEIIERLVKPLYQLFDFFTPPPNMYSEEISRMLKRV